MESNSLVLELQRDSTNPSMNVADLLRKSLLVARKLKVEDMRRWIESELNGYGESEIPAYRTLRGQPKARNPFLGWIPIQSQELRVEELISTVSIKQAVSEIQHLVNRAVSVDRTLRVPHGHSLERILQQQGGHDFQTAVEISPESLVGIIDQVRTIVMNWSIQLEEDGIVGQGVTFTSSEISTAAKHQYNINIFMGNVSESQVQQGSNNSEQRIK